MGWNEPGDKDPWGNRKQPPDLDEALKTLMKRFQGLMKGRTKASSKKNVKNPLNTSLPPGLLMASLVGVVFFLWILSGIFIVDPAEQAVILRFGRYIKTVGAGPHWIPRFIDTKILVNVDRVSDYSYTAQMLTKDENLVSVAVAVQYKISDLEDYLFTVAAPLESLQQATSSALRQVVGQTTLDQLITEGREAWGSSVQETLIRILASYKTGIMIVNVSPQPARAPENVQAAFDDAIKAQEDEKRFKEQARAYEARVVPIAEGNAKRITAEAKADATQVVLRAKGDVAEFLSLLPIYTHAPWVTGQRMYFDAMQRVFTNSRTVILDGRSGNMVYVPLDKLLSADGGVSRAKAKSTPHPLSLNQAASDLFEGRTTSRPTENLGSNPS